MDRWAGKVAVVTGASSGIGEAIAENLLNSDIKVVGLSRRKERMDKMSEKFKGKPFYGVKTDVRSESDILTAFKWIIENVGPISILINNAGVLINSSLINGTTQDFVATVETNVCGLAIATREAIQRMIKDQNDGHIVHINSIVGHYVPYIHTMNMYPATKHAVTALTETLRQELNTMDSKIKISSISPGIVNTEIFEVNGYSSSNESNSMLNQTPMLKSKDVANAVAYVLSTPPNVQITELTIRPVGEKF